MNPKFCHVFSGILAASSLLASVGAFAAPGDRDPTYGDLGRKLIDASTPGLGVFVQPNRFIQQADGKTVVIGWTESSTVPGPQDFAVVRLDANGNLDSSFDNDGVAIIGFFTTDQGIGIVEQGDGKLVVVGLANSGICTSSPCMAVARLNTNGSLDGSFGGNAGTGKLVITAPQALNSVAIDAVMQGTNIVIGGHKGFADYIFLRLNSAGVLDTTFNNGLNGGVSIIDMGASPMLMNKMIVQSDTKLVAVGNAGLTASVQQLGIARVTSEGIADTTFGSSGTIVSTCVGLCQHLRVAQQPDQKLLVVGFDAAPAVGSPPLPQGRSVIERRNVDGSLDASFGTGGRIVNLFAAIEPHPIHVGEVASSVNVDPISGAIVIAGRLTTTSYATTGNPTTGVVRQGVARLTSTGAVDTTFGTGGARMLPPGLGQGLEGYSTVWYNSNVLPDGRVMLLGQANQVVGGVTVMKGMAVARLTNGPSNAGVLNASGFPVQENAGFAWAVVARSAGSTGAVSVQYSTASGTAIAGSDFVQTSGTLTWADGDVRTKLIKVPLIRDSVTETTDETFDIILSNPTGGADIANDPSITIYRDDLNPPNTITVSSSPSIVFESSGSITFTVSRTGTDPICVNYTTAWDSANVPVAQSPSDYTHANGILVWGQNDTAPKTITIPIVNDTAAESAEELNLAFFLAGGGAVVTNSLQTVTIHNSSPPQISIAATATVSEGQSSVIVNVTRTGSSTVASGISFATSNGTALAGSDYASTAGSVSWAVGDPDVKTITIPLISDTSIEGSETFTVTLSNPTGSATLGATVTSTVTITDDDTAAPPASGGGGGGGGATTIELLLALLALLSLQALHTRKAYLSHRG